jgi:GntR family transcriptional regulator, histidine utilization repressor
MGAPLTLGRRIRADVEAQIKGGHWPPGYRLPTEQELQTHYGCARATVGKALSALADAGLVERRKRAGTIVATPRAHTAVLTIPDLAEVMAARGQAYRFELTERVVRPADPASNDERELIASGPMIELSGLHHADSDVFAIERRVISLDQVPEAQTEDFAQQAPGTWLLQHIPWTRARHRISACSLSGEGAKRMGLPKGSACLRLERWTWREDAGITYVEQTFAADQYDLVAEFSPGKS